MTTENLTQITWPEVQAGDVLLRDNGDRLIVQEVCEELENSVLTSAGWRFAGVLEKAGFTPHRKQPKLPTEPGAYLDKHGHLWELCSGDIWSYSGDRISHETAAHFAPFTRLVPMPTDEQVLEALESTQHESNLDSDVAAVMALLTGKEADSE